MLPDFAIIGAQKSASSFIHECVSDHPDIYIPNEETPFFQDELYNPNDLSWLHFRFDNNKSDVAIRRGIKRPDYLAMPECAERISKHIPNAQFIVVLRDPVDRFVSAYFHYAKHGFVPICDFNHAAREIICGSWSEKWPRSKEILVNGNYAKSLEYWFGLFPASNFLVLSQEQIKKEPRAVVKATYNFLGVDSEYQPTSKLKLRPKASVYNDTRLHILRLASKLAFYREPNQHMLRSKRIGNGTIGYVSSRFISSLDDFLLSKIFVNSKPIIERDVAFALRGYYEEDWARARRLFSGSPRES